VSESDILSAKKSIVFNLEKYARRGSERRRPREVVESPRRRSGRIRRVESVTAARYAASRRTAKPNGIAFESPVMPTVEYLNYEVLDDHGWDMDDGDLFDKAADAGLGDEDYGSLEVNQGEYILEAAEAQGYDWPFSCRAGACANCAAIVKEGDIEMDMQQILSDEEVEEKNVRLTCIGSPTADEVKIVYNAKHLDYLQNRVI
jgi:2Fe-2S type ferredoxin